MSLFDSLVTEALRNQCQFLSRFESGVLVLQRSASTCLRLYLGRKCPTTHQKGETYVCGQLH